MGLPTKLLFRACYIPDRHQKGVTHSPDRAAGSALWNASVPAVRWHAQHRHAAWSQPLLSTAKALHDDTEVPVQWQDIMKGPRKVLLRMEMPRTLPKEERVCGTGDTDWQPGVAKCSWCKALDNSPMLLMVWSETTRRKPHYMPYLQSVQICRNIICIICVSLCVLSSILPAYIVLVHEQIHTLGESKTAFSAKSLVITPKNKKTFVDIYPVPTLNQYVIWQTFSFKDQVPARNSQLGLSPLSTNS